MLCTSKQITCHHSNTRICPYHRKREYLSKEIYLATCHVNFCASYVSSQESGPKHPGVNRVSMNKLKGTATARAASSSTCRHLSLDESGKGPPQSHGPLAPHMGQLHKPITIIILAGASHAQSHSIPRTASGAGVTPR